MRTSPGPAFKVFLNGIGFIGYIGSDRNEPLTVLRWHTSDHEIIPEPGTARRVREGESADLTRPLDYPCEALCLECGQPIRCERWFLGEWVQIERFTDPAG